VNRAQSENTIVARNRALNGGRGRTLDAKQIEQQNAELPSSRAAGQPAPMSIEKCSKATH